MIKDYYIVLLALKREYNLIFIRKELVMGIQNTQYAAVNLSSTTISVYSGTVSSSIHVGGITAGGSVVGMIYPNEFYIVIPNSSAYITSFKIYFRDGNGNARYGYIETSKGTTLGDYSWNAHQHPYHYYNTSGRVLVESEQTVPINGVIYRVFTVKRNVVYRNSSGEAIGTLSTGMEIACRSSQTGQTYKSHMIFYYKRTPPGTWTRMSAGVDYAFVDLDIENGTMPYNRAIW